MHIASMRDMMDLAITNVEAVTVRGVAGHDSDQALLTVRTKHGTLTLRLVGTHPIRFTDLRLRDKRRGGRTRLVAVPMTAVKPTHE